ncbi:MAG: pyruvate kinase [Bacillota bacterium]|nr:pyruvate kinase [Bacillota bacterium]
MRKTKIICTIGPASENKETLMQMIQNGMNVARLNFSHGVYEEHENRIKRVREAARVLQRPVAVMLDTKGPEIRTGFLREKKVRLITGQHFVLTTREVEGTADEVQITYSNLPQEVEKGITILLSDGLINLFVEETTDTDIICTVVNGGELGEKKGVNVPGVRINLPFLSEKDREDLNFGIDQAVDYIAASFVRCAEDVLEIRRIVEERDADIEIIAKIESQGGVDHLEEIIQVADGIMVARGDLGVEIPPEEVPLVQKLLVEKCNTAGKVVIIATQMLDSMIQNPRPTRAEVSDVANAIYDGADAIMLSGETAAGKYPVEAVETMARIAGRTEEVLPYSEILRKKRRQGILSVTDSISYATCATASSLGVTTIITGTQTGTTARMVSKYRPAADIIAVTPKKRILAKLALVWGVHPVLAQETSGTDQLIDESLRICEKIGYIKQGDMVVLTAGSPTGFSGGTNLLKVHVVGDVLVKGTGIGHHAVSGSIKVILHDEDLSKVVNGDILVTIGAFPALVPILEKVQALVAEEGGLTSDAAIIGLNMGIPVIVGATDATKILKDDMVVTIDTRHGKIYNGVTKVE